ncbi:MAG TPA: VOC family protein [Puia sp.]|jgi:predicted 3-demethylubiquinone-9 3-methyltransferase (glyoxalase superfamily)|nr:VOC family protein [Puia sp.]
MKAQKMSICLWFDTQAEEAATFYTSIFRNSSISSVSRYGKEGFEFHRMPEGTAMVVNFRINDLDIMGLNGGPVFKFSEAISIVVNCETQDEIDFLWEELTKGGEENQCGWLKDRYGVSWQIVPAVLSKLMSDPARSPRVMKAFLAMKKFDIEKLLQA